MHFREYPLLNTPHLVIVLLKEAARGAASVEECATRLWAILEAADEHPPVGADEVLRRLDMLRRNLTEAQLVAPADGEPLKSAGLSLTPSTLGFAVKTTNATCCVTTGVLMTGLSTAALTVMSYLLG